MTHMFSDQLLSHSVGDWCRKLKLHSKKTWSPEGNSCFSVKSTWIYIYIYISTDTCFILPRIHQCRLHQRLENSWCHQSPRSIRCWALQNACGILNEQKIFCSHQCSTESSVNKFREYISTNTCFVLSRTQSVWLGLTIREQLMSPECSKHQVLSFAKLLVMW